MLLVNFFKEIHMAQLLFGYDSHYCDALSHCVAMG